ncbi:hypothetical protein KIL84_019485, partial [Mauremys mutica]
LSQPRPARYETPAPPSLRAAVKRGGREPCRAAGCQAALCGWAAPEKRPRRPRSLFCCCCCRWRK